MRIAIVGIVVGIFGMIAMARAASADPAPDVKADDVKSPIDFQVGDHSTVGVGNITIGTLNAAPKGSGSGGDDADTKAAKAAVQRAMEASPRDFPVCIVSTKDRTVSLAFGADGLPLCLVPSTPDTYRFVVSIWTEDGRGQEYTVSVDHGAVDNSVIRGTGALTVAELTYSGTALSKLTSTSKGTWGPFHHLSDVTFNVADDKAGVKQSTKVSLLHPYFVNLGLAVLVGSGTTTYSVANKMIQSDSTHADISYDAMFHVYPATWFERRGRVFDHTFESCWDLWSIVGGFSVSNPTGSLFAGIGFEPIVGLTIVGGWQFRRLPQLKSGFDVGNADADSSAPTHEHGMGGVGKWPMTIGISFDASLAKAIASAIAESK